jgi:hypothetical protein
MWTMTNVYLLIHDDRSMDMGDTCVRGIYADRVTAEADLVTRTPSGAKSRAYGAHDTYCCSVDEWDVLTAATPDIQDDPKPLTPEEADGGAIVPRSMVTRVFEEAARPYTHHHRPLV